MAELLAFSHHNRDQDAVEISHLYRQARSSPIEGARYLIEAGRKLLAKKASPEMKHGDWLRWLRDNADVLGFEHRSTPSRLMNVATKCCASATFDDLDVHSAAGLIQQVWGHASNDGQRGSRWTGENEWFTPDECIEAARAVLGTIDLDPASHADAPHIARQRFTSEDDGLSREWHGTVWLNPPYARGEIDQFVAKLLQEIGEGRTTAAIMLTHNYTDTDWFQTAARDAAALCFPKGRIRFRNRDGERAKPTQGQAFFYYGPNLPGFSDVFADFGLVLIPAPPGDAPPCRAGTQRSKRAST